jgi:hypothetical protein
MLLVVLSCSTKKPPCVEQKVILRYVYPDMLTIVDVSCEGLDSDFSHEIKEIEFKKGTHDFHVIDSLFSYFEEDTSIESIDVRIKIISNAKNDSIICMDNLGQFFSVRKNRYMKNEALKDFILKIVNDNY